MPTKSKKINNDTHHGRPPKPDKAHFGQITCVLRHDTIERLRAGSGSKHFGEFLQAHLDRYPPPTRTQYLAMIQRTEYYTLVKRKKVPTLIAAGSLSREAKRLAKERARRERLTPKQREWEDSLKEGVTKVVQEHYAGHSS
jgi:hypothetical protein